MYCITIVNIYIGYKFFLYINIELFLVITIYNLINVVKKISMMTMVSGQFESKVVTIFK